MIKHLDNNTKHLEVLLCYDLTKKITNEGKQIFFTVELNLFIIGTITLWNQKKLMLQFLVKKLELRI
jgi:hypothetical protein